jgi:hypothetical protein
MKQHIDLSTPCIDVALNRRPMVMIKADTKHGFNNHALARIVLLSYLHLPIDSREGCVCHACDNNKCINPQHLYLGTQANNIKDQIEAGTHSSKLTGNNGQMRMWRCVSPSGNVLFKQGLKRVSELTGLPPSAISPAAKHGKIVKGWSFQKLDP